MARSISARVFPEGDGPADVREAAARAILEGLNQYPPMRGTAQLRAAIAEHYGRLQGVALDPEREVCVTSGATEALAAAMLAVLEPGDEIVLFEPMYDSYMAMAERAGAIVRLVRLEPPHWRIDPALLAAACGPKTRAILVNTPLNPSGSVFEAEDIAAIASAAERADAIVIADEVWEHVVFPPARHRSLLADTRLRERTIKIGSAGKMFSMTGWKVGFACAAPALMDVFAKAHQYLTFTTPPHLQAAVAFGLGKPASHFAEMCAGFAAGRDRLCAALTNEGFALLPVSGAYFVTIDLVASGIHATAEDFARRAVTEAGVATIPYAAFYAAPKTAPALVRLCFAKSAATLDAGAEGLAKARGLFA
jgi:aspartate/methionine/tyrosine aminotransferase